MTIKQPNTFQLRQRAFKLDFFSSHFFNSKLLKKFHSAHIFFLPSHFKVENRELYSVHITKWERERASSNRAFVWISNHRICEVNYLPERKRERRLFNYESGSFPFNSRNHAEICKWWMEYISRRILKLSLTHSLGTIIKMCIFHFSQKVNFKLYCFRNSSGDRVIEKKKETIEENNLFKNFNGFLIFEKYL